MSSKNHSSFGHLVAAAEMTKLLPAINQREFTNLISESDTEVLLNYLFDNLPKHFPRPDNVFIMADEVEFDDENLKKGEIYVEFSESDLYEKKPTLGMSYLTANGVKPVERRWVDFG